MSVAVADCVCVWCCADGTPSATLQLLCRLATPLSQMHEDGHWAAHKATQSSSTPASHSQTPSVSHSRFLSLLCLTDGFLGIQIKILSFLFVIGFSFVLF